jgi:hypothetical protein
MITQAATGQHTLARQDAERLWLRWLEMWNSDPAIAHQIIAPGYRLHLPGVETTIDPAGITDAASMEAWVSGFTGKFRDMRYETDFGPLVDGDRLVCRWYATAIYLGRTSWARDIPGNRVIFIGVDILRVAGGLITECWSQAKEALAIP